MNINVRFNGALAQKIGTSRLQVQIQNPGAVSDLINHLQAQYPQAAPQFKQVVPFVAGQHLSLDAPLSDNQEVALLLPVAGG